MAKSNKIMIYLAISLVAFIAMVLYNSILMNETVSIKENLTSSPIMISPETIGGISTRNLPEVAIDVYGPPLRDEPLNIDFCRGYPINSTDVRGSLPVKKCNCVEGLVPVNIETRGTPCEFTQVGILKNDTKMQDKVLSLFGRKITTGSDKWQYYTLSNVGIMPTRLPIHVVQNGGKPKDGMCEYGIDRLYSGDVVIVDGYNDDYVVQIYENRQYRYIG